DHHQNAVSLRLLGVRRPDAALALIGRYRYQSGARPPHSKTAPITKSLVKTQILAHKRSQVAVVARPVRRCQHLGARVLRVDHRDVELVIAESNATFHRPIPNKARVRSYLDAWKRRASPKLTRVKQRTTG